MYSFFIFFCFFFCCCFLLTFALLARVRCASFVCRNSVLIPGAIVLHMVSKSLSYRSIICKCFHVVGNKSQKRLWLRPLVSDTANDLLSCHLLETISCRLVLYSALPINSLNGNCSPFPASLFLICQRKQPGICTPTTVPTVCAFSPCRRPRRRRLHPRQTMCPIYLPPWLWCTARIEGACIIDATARIHRRRRPQKRAF